MVCGGSRPPVATMRTAISRDWVTWTFSNASGRMTLLSPGGKLLLLLLLGTLWASAEGCLQHTQCNSGQHCCGCSSLCADYPTSALASLAACGQRCNGVSPTPPPVTTSNGAACSVPEANSMYTPIDNVQGGGGRTQAGPSRPMPRAARPRAAARTIAGGRTAVAILRNLSSSVSTTESSSGPSSGSCSAALVVTAGTNVCQLDSNLRHRRRREPRQQRAVHDRRAKRRRAQLDRNLPHRDERLPRHQRPAMSRKHRAGQRGSGLQLHLHLAKRRIHLANSFFNTNQVGFSTQGLLLLV